MTDSGGATASASVAITVQRVATPEPPVSDYVFGGFEPPVTPDGTVKAGRTIPVKWTVTGANVSAATVVSSAFTDGGATYAMVRNGGTWQVNAATPKAWAGSTRTFRVGPQCRLRERLRPRLPMRSVAGRHAGRRVLAAAALSLAMGLRAACGSDSPDSPDPSGSGSPDSSGLGGLVGHMSGTSDVEGQPGDPAAGGGGLAVIPIAAMDGPFWDLTGEELVADPQGWAYLAPQLSEVNVSQLGGKVVPIDGEGNFGLSVPPREYAVCYWPGDIGGRLTGCDAVELPTEGELEASWGEAGFHISVAG